MQNEELLTPEQASAHLGGVPAATLQFWRCRGGGPRFVKIGRAVFYRRRDVVEFIEQSVREPGA